MYQHGGTDSDVMDSPIHARGEVRKSYVESKSVKRVTERVVGTRSALGARSQSRCIQGLSKVFVGRNSKAQE